MKGAKKSEKNPTLLQPRINSESRREADSFLWILRFSQKPAPGTTPNSAAPNNAESDDGGEKKPKPNGAAKKTNGHGEGWAHCHAHATFRGHCKNCAAALTKAFADEEVELEKKRKKETPKEKRIHPGRLHPNSILAKHALDKVMRNHFKPMQRKTAKELQKAVKKIADGTLAKADSQDEALKKILKALAADWIAIGAESLEPLEDSALAGAIEGALQLDITDEGMLSKISAVAKEWASRRAAELVGMKVSESGKLIPNPDAKWAISDTTRDKIKQIITDIFAEEKPTMASIEQRIMDAGIFDDSRASMIARTEISRAQTQGNLDSWKTSGLVKSVNWELSGSHDTDDECDDLADGSPYDIDGVPDLPAHPACMCSLILNEIEGE